MTTLVVGATGATGKHVVEHLLQAGQQVKVVVRSPEKIPASWKDNPRVTVIQAGISEIAPQQMAEYLKDCTGAVSCLGHNVTWKGMYGKPRRLVTDSIGLLCDAITRNAPETPVKLILMNSSGVRNRDLSESISLAQRLVIGLLRLLLPPHVDNEKAADYLRTQIGQRNPFIQWVAVRPDGLVNEDAVTPYEAHPSPTRSAIFNAGSISRINVGHFMARLILDSGLWNQWKGHMPVLYSSGD